MIEFLTSKDIRRTASMLAGLSFQHCAITVCKSLVIRWFFQRICCDSQHFSSKYVEVNVQYAKQQTHLWMQPVPCLLREQNAVAPGRAARVHVSLRVRRVFRKRIPVKRREVTTRALGTIINLEHSTRSRVLSVVYLRATTNARCKYYWGKKTKT